MIWFRRITNFLLLFIVTVLVLQKCQEHTLTPYKERLAESLPPLTKTNWLDAKAARQDLPILYIRWEIWCPACLGSIEKNNEIASTFEKKLEVIGLIQQWDDGVQDFARKTIKYPVGQDLGQVLDRFFEIQAIPFYTLIDKDRKVLYQGNSIEPSVIDKLL